MLYQSSIHYRTLLIFQNKKNNRFEGQNMGGIKDMSSPPHVKTWGGYITPIPPRIYALAEVNVLGLMFDVYCRIPTIDSTDTNHWTV